MMTRNSRSILIYTCLFILLVVVYIHKSAEALVPDNVLSISDPAHIAPFKDGKIIVICRTNGTVRIGDEDIAPYNIAINDLIVCVNQDGSVDWVRRVFGTMPGSIFSDPNSIVVSSDGYILLRVVGSAVQTSADEVTTYGYAPYLGGWDSYLIFDDTGTKVHEYRHEFESTLPMILSDGSYVEQHYNFHYPGIPNQYWDYLTFEVSDGDPAIGMTIEPSGTAQLSRGGTMSITARFGGLHNVSYHGQHEVAEFGPQGVGYYSFNLNYRYIDPNDPFIFIGAGGIPGRSLDPQEVGDTQIIHGLRFLNSRDHHVDGSIRILEPQEGVTFSAGDIVGVSLNPGESIDLPMVVSGVDEFSGGEPLGIGATDIRIRYSDDKGSSHKASYDYTTRCLFYAEYTGTTDQEVWWTRHIKHSNQNGILCLPLFSGRFADDYYCPPMSGDGDGSYVPLFIDPISGEYNIPATCDYHPDGVCQSFSVLSTASTAGDYSLVVAGLGSEGHVIMFDKSGVPLWHDEITDGYSSVITPTVCCCLPDRGAYVFMPRDGWNYSSDNNRNSDGLFREYSPEGYVIADYQTPPLLGEEESVAYWQDRTPSRLITVDESTGKAYLVRLDWGETYDGMSSIKPDNLCLNYLEFSVVAGVSAPTVLAHILKPENDPGDWPDVTLDNAFCRNGTLHVSLRLNGVLDFESPAVRDGSVLLSYELEAPPGLKKLIDVKVISENGRAGVAQAMFFTCDEDEIGPFTSCDCDDPHYTRDLDSDGYARLYDFNLAENINYQERNSIRVLYLLDIEGSPLGDIGFVYPKYFHAGDIKKEAIVFLHDDLSSYQEHPIEHDNKEWERLRKWQGRCENIPEDARMYPVSMLIPPFAEEHTQLGSPSIKSYSVDNARPRAEGGNPEAKPVLFVHGLYGTDMYWGTENEEFDYTLQSVPAMLNIDMREDPNVPIDIWEFYYPPDQDWRESGILLQRAVEYLHNDIGYNQPVTLVAHSMGGLVSRSYLENKSTGYLHGGRQFLGYYSHGDVDRAIFLATPQHGSFGGNRNFGELWFNDIIASTSDVQQDPEAPSIRELSIGSLSMMALNRDFYMGQPFKPSGVEYIQFSGTTFAGLVPSHIGHSPDIKESHPNSDGIVSASSGNLIQYPAPSEDHIPVYYLKDFSHHGFKDPWEFLDPERGTQEQCDILSPDRLVTDYVAWIVKDVLAGRPAVASLPGEDYVYIAGDLASINDAPDFARIAVEPYEHRFDVALPIVEFFNDAESMWLPRFSGRDNYVPPVRFTVGHVDYANNGTPQRLELIYEVVYKEKDLKKSDHRFALLHSGLLYDNMRLLDNSYHHKIQRVLSLSAFYAFSDLDWIHPENVLSVRGESTQLSEGAGWLIPDRDRLQLGVRISKWFILTNGEKKSVPLPGPDDEDKLRLQRSTTTYSAIHLPQQTIRALEAGHYRKVKGTLSEKQNIDSAVEYPHQIDSDTEWLLFLVSGISNSLDIQMVDPNQVHHDVYSSEIVEVLEDTFVGTGIYSVHDPEPGTWTLRVGGAENTDSLLVIAEESNRHEAVLSIEEESDNGSDYLVSARVLGEPDTYDVISAEMQVTNIEDGTTTTDALRDDGLQPDFHMQDGYYSAIYKASNTEDHIIEVVFSLDIDGEVITRSQHTLAPKADTVIRRPNYMIQNGYPNPFNPSTALAFKLDSASDVGISVYNVSGRRLASVFSGVLPAGPHEFTWDGVNNKGETVASGVYFWRMEANGEVETLKMTLVR